MHATVPVRFGRGRLDSLGNKGLAAYLILRAGRSGYARVTQIMLLTPTLSVQPH